jgi:DNA-binding ferritin-like protein (Dps family)
MKGGLEMDDTYIECPYGYENCIGDDVESLCSGCKEDKVEAWHNAYHDTYD